jgi:hypothetical protein
MLRTARPLSPLGNGRVRYGAASESDAIRLAVRLVAESKRVDVRQDADDRMRTTGCGRQDACDRMRTTMAETRLRKTLKDTLIPTPVQEWG